MTELDAVDSNATLRRRKEPLNRRRQNFNNLLRNNQLGIIDNPLNYVTPDELDNDVHQFYKYHHLEHVVEEELLLRGARLARDGVNYQNYTEVERKALEDEDRPTLPSQPRALQTILLACSIGAIVQGWTQANLTGADLSWPGELFGARNRPFTNAETWKFGAVNSITYFSCALLGGWLSDPLSEHAYGRRGALFIAGLFSLASCIGSGYVNSWQGLFACRVTQGIGMGAKASIVPIFESEVSPAKIRGRFLVSWQTFVAFGIFLGSCSNIIFHDSWRWQLASGFIPAVPLLFLVLVCSESPHWLMKHGRYVDAWRAYRGLRETPLQAARDFYQLHCQLQVESILLGSENEPDEENRGPLSKQTNFFQRFGQLFTIPRNRRASLAACVVMASQQLSGINIFAFLSNTFISNSTSFSTPNISHIRILSLSLGFALANAVFSSLAYFTIDSKGRRFLLLLSLILMVPLLIAAGLSLKISHAHPNNSVRVGVFETFLILYTAAYSPGAGVVPFLYSSEIFPMVHREVGMSLSCSVNFVLAGILALTVPQLQFHLGQTRLLCLFAGLDALAVILVWLFVPGTRKAVSLTIFNYIFGVPTRVHVRYQVSTVFPWVLTSCIPWLIKDYIPWILRWYFCCGAGSYEWSYVRERLPHLHELYVWRDLRMISRREQGHQDASDSDNTADG
ncbi:sugar transporter, putative [Talaromyces stipitatus ATCC 10500]|uniref:Sugar transporter, putative n=1 Tax=Talaromyces stipitatus (strain ATCC 10500 / CBS 375.48 / QM 6759 / NRRL 1006) TaxID=441959 RepID=B8ML12_TALSN|nr:sugar transporter, putative [Talaromyces stipitatus ATCC 10500]EED15428.1 sugar transporter, putative [Talaromyces stipitatus ATCC 10500]